MTVLSFAQDGIIEITAKRAGETLTLRKVTEESEDKNTPSVSWKTEAGEVWDKDQVNRLLSILSRLRCSRYGEEGMSLGKELVNVSLRSEDRGYTISFHEQVDNQYPGLSSESGYPFFVASYQYDDVAGIFTPPEAEE
jgi:hypothetical protein